MIGMGRRATRIIQDMHALAESKGGKCLSTKYINANTKLQWQCAKGHIWEAHYNSISSIGTWCPTCSGCKKKTIEDMHAFAESKGGKCLSTKYINSITKLQWQCDKGHIWDAVPRNLFNAKSWCLVCSGYKKKTIEDMHALAESKGGKCLSTEYINNHTKLQWQCDKGHIWDAVYIPIRNGHWCPTCSGLKKKTIEDMHAFAESKGGKCLSKKYVSKKNLKWQCAKGHIWEATYNKSWCPMCKSHVSEEICRLTFEKIFNTKFTKLRPKWLTTEIGTRLELDGYCKKFNIAFEYNGEQHYKPVPWSPSWTKEEMKKKLVTQKSRDYIKKTLCKKNNLTLIIINYLDKLDNLPSIIKERCEKQNHDISKIDFNQNFEIDEIELTEADLKRCKDHAKKLGGKCLSTKYINSGTKLQWQCAKGHIWEATSSNILHKKSWCPVCAGKKKKTIEDMYAFAKSKGGKCLSNEYINNSTKLQWQCAKGHIWEATPGGIKKGTWCPICARKIRAETRRRNISKLS
jgi:hypothetical protein